MSRMPVDLGPVGEQALCGAQMRVVAVVERAAFVSVVVKVVVGEEGLMAPTHEPQRAVDTGAECNWPRPRNRLRPGCNSPKNNGRRRTS